MRIVDVEAINCCQVWIEQYVPWSPDKVGAAVDSRPPLEEAHWDVIRDVEKSLRCVLHVFREWGVPNLYGEWNYEHTNVRPWLLYRIYSVLPVTYVVLLERRERRLRRVCHHRPNAHFVLCAYCA
ncbi:hypothetical protein EVAR_58231_1 [Eumeta japonica]|uniref:Uncharacterized protein n=1 Tax=Eumeta variegata TaxID=151549 RepID=A0A4C2AHJ1_EUMVA|nr:hypothetical protein EVAR_58231_1 [Eumeta japonica]